MEVPAQLNTPPLGLPGQEHFRTPAGAYLLPIEWFKQGARLPCEINTEDGITYLSSGTTGGGRSQSPYSAAGLRRYRDVALEGFYRVLSAFLPLPKSIPILSLVPPWAQMPQSSLAHMLHFFCEQWSVQYLTPAELGRMAPGLRQPVCVFGTTAHFLDVAASLHLRLPRGSIAIETGGLKVLGQSFDRKSLHQKIVASLGIVPARIISEYGMAELASQAYDWRQPDAKGTRRFRFPSHVDIFVSRGLGRIERQGIGALVVYDRARVDLPWPIRTQDLVRLYPDGFEYLGRVPQSVLKGCSLSFPMAAK